MLSFTSLDWVRLLLSTGYDRPYKHVANRDRSDFIGKYFLRNLLRVWRDSGGRLSALRIVTLMCLFAPLGKMLYDSDSIRHDPRPVTNLIHRTGDWSLIFLFVALAVSPLSRILRFSQLLDVRRMVGIGAFAYATAHFTLYTIDLMFNWREIASEIVHRTRLTLGFAALLGLTALTATSTDSMVRRLGAKRWQRLHQAIYAVTILVLIHYFLRFKLIETTPTFATIDCSSGGAIPVRSCQRGCYSHSAAWLLQ